MKQRGALLGRATVFVLAVTIVACSRNPIPVGFAGPLSGSSSDLGVQGRNGATLAIEEINEAGGIAGRPLELIARDDWNDPDLVPLLNTELVEEGVVATIGHMTSAPSVVAAALGERGRVLHISPTASAPDLSSRDDLFSESRAPLINPLVYLESISPASILPPASPLFLTPETQRSSNRTGRAFQTVSAVDPRSSTTNRSISQR